MPKDLEISRRKQDHLDITASGRAEAQRTTLLEHVHLVHQSLPELAVADIDLSTELAGATLAAPLVITGMTGGTPEAAAVNRDLARAAQARGVAFGVGSQRAMAEHPELLASYQVRDVAPDVVLFGNVGVVQAMQMGPAKVIALATQIGANAMCVHLNPGQELIQDHGDRDFRGCVAAIRTLVAQSPVPIIVKETGCGLSAQAARALVGAGVTTVDVSGAGGTSWVAVEALRGADDSAQRQLGNELWDWGVPTAVSVIACVKAGVTTIASGGLRSGYDIARALALGATAGGMAQPFLKAQRAGGEAAVIELIDRTINAIRTVCLLTGSRSPKELARAPKHLGRELQSFIEDFA